MSPIGSLSPMDTSMSLYRSGALPGMSGCSIDSLVSTSSGPCQDLNDHRF